MGDIHRHMQQMPIKHFHTRWVFFILSVGLSLFLPMMVRLMNSLHKKNKNKKMYVSREEKHITNQTKTHYTNVISRFLADIGYLMILRFNLAKTKAHAFLSGC